jgi:hypothetical protein
MSDGEVDLSKLKRDVEYTLQHLTDIFPFGIQALRKQIKQGKLKARKKGKLILVRGSDAIAWWKK